MLNLSEFCSAYEKFSFSHNYIIGFSYKGNIYAHICHMEDMTESLHIDSASQKNGGGHSLRFTPSTAFKKSILDKCFLLMTTSKFEDEVQNSIYNKGEVFEKAITEKYSQVWVKDNVPFYMGGDIEVNGIPYQIKFQKATFCTEKQLEKLS